MPLKVLFTTLVGSGNENPPQIRITAVACCHRKNLVPHLVHDPVIGGGVYIPSWFTYNELPGWADPIYEPIELPEVHKLHSDDMPSVSDILVDAEASEVTEAPKLSALQKFRSAGKKIIMENIAVRHLSMEEQLSEVLNVYVTAYLDAVKNAMSNILAQESAAAKEEAASKANVSSFTSWNPLNVGKSKETVDPDKTDASDPIEFGKKIRVCIIVFIYENVVESKYYFILGKS
jgi:hypothetical protein